jgi:hypothetical protein
LWSASGHIAPHLAAAFETHLETRGAGDETHETGLGWFDPQPIIAPSANFPTYMLEEVGARLRTVTRRLCSSAPEWVTYGSRMRQRDQRIQARGRELLALVSPHLPQEFEVTGDADAWPLIATALMSRMTTTLGTVLDLQPSEREVDAGILVRNLYEHAVHLAWLAADPTAARIQEWRKDDLSSRLKADSDARARGVELFSDEARSALEAQVAAMQGSKLVLADLAIAADGCWANALPGMGGHRETKSFRGLYAILYRNYSGVAHATYRGLNPVVEDLSPIRRQVRLEGHYEGNGPYGIATVIFTLALYIVADPLGWPNAGAINPIFEKYL